MKTTQILYLILLVVAIIWVASSTHLLDSVVDGFKDKFNPTIPKGVKVSKLNTEALPNPIASGQLPYGPYAQQASVGSYPYQDPSDLPTTLDQLRKLFEDVRGFLVFEGVSISNISDPTVQLPLTQLRADSRRLEQEITVLSRNPGIASTMTQQHFADIQEQLYFLQKKVRLFQTSGVIKKEGFTSDTSGTSDATSDATGDASSDASSQMNGKSEKTRATYDDLMNLRKKVYAAILVLSSSGTTDPVVVARLQALQNMYTSVGDMINKIETGNWTEIDITVYKEDIENMLPNLGDTTKALDTVMTGLGGSAAGGSAGGGSAGGPQDLIVTQISGAGGLSPVIGGGNNQGASSLLSQALGQFVGPENVNSVLASLQDKGLFRLNLELGYNVHGKPLNSDNHTLTNNGKDMNNAMLNTTINASLNPNLNPSLNPSATVTKNSKISNEYGNGVSDIRNQDRLNNGLRNEEYSPLITDSPFDSMMMGSEERQSKQSEQLGGLDWKKRTAAICEQIRLRGLDPLDFGCIAKGSSLSPAYSWRGHAKMVCGRLGATLDPGLPELCGCPPSSWPGWTTFQS